MSKRWFDLIAMIIFGCYFGLSSLDEYYFLGNEWLATNGFLLILLFALRRFFYNKEK
jgi:hypothetical protein